MTAGIESCGNCEVSRDKAAKQGNLPRLEAKTEAPKHSKNALQRSILFSLFFVTLYQGAVSKFDNV